MLEGWSSTTLEGVLPRRRTARREGVAVEIDERRAEAPPSASTPTAESLRRRFADWLRGRLPGRQRHERVLDLTSEAMSLADEGHHLEAEAKLREAEAVLRQGVGGETRARFVEQKAKLLARQGRFEEASALLIACERWWARRQDLDRRASVVCQRGAVLLSAGQTAVARDLLRGAVEQLEGRVSAVLVWELLHELAIAEVALGERM